jgi:hypothetical protein
MNITSLETAPSKTLYNFLPLAIPTWQMSTLARCNPVLALPIQDPNTNEKYAIFVKLI